MSAYGNIRSVNSFIREITQGKMLLGHKASFQLVFTKFLTVLIHIAILWWICCVWLQPNTATPETNRHTVMVTSIVSKQEVVFPCASIHASPDNQFMQPQTMRHVNTQVKSPSYSLFLWAWIQQATGYPIIIWEVLKNISQ